MGNGASIGYIHPYGTDIDAKVVDELEYRCRKGYYQSKQNHNDLLLDFTQAVHDNRLDLIEIFLTCQHIESIYPLHIACQHGGLEVVELLVSASIKVISRDEKGRTSLHRAASSSSSTSYLCALYLCLEYPKLINLQDHDGLTALHIAVLNQSMEVARILIQHKASIKIKNKENHTAVALARRSNHKDMIDLLCPPQHKPVSTIPGIQHEQDEIVDVDKIMLVWDAFFENVSKYIESKHQDTPLLSPHMTRVEDIIQEWSNYILIYDPDLTSSKQEQYYILHKHHNISYSLSEYAARMSDYDFIDFQSSDNQLPMTLIDAIKHNWMAFYDCPSNHTCWMHVETNHCEDYLPIGQDDHIYTCSPLIDKAGITRHPDEEYKDWIVPDHICSTSWMLVICDTTSTSEYDDNHVDAMMYYSNQLTGISIWHEPVGWKDQCDKVYDGWMICCYETQLSALFWWHEATGNSKWIESDQIDNHQSIYVT